MKNKVVKLGIGCGMLGACSVSLGLSLYANYLWVVANGILVYHNYRKDDRDQMMMCTVYGLIAIYGILNLSGVV